MAKREYSLLIRGNPEDPKGNPIPCVRMTRSSKYTNEGAQRYLDWKDLVAWEFCKKYEATGNKPIGGSPRGRVILDIEFKGEAHADPDNIVKGVLDALFDNDKEIDVETHHVCKRDVGVLKVHIMLED